MQHMMQIESLEIENYRLFRKTSFTDLPRMVVIVGPNGSGKSTLFDIFSFLKQALIQNVAVAVAQRGGFRELVSRGEKGPISLTIKFRESTGRLATYMLKIGLDQGRPVVEREILKFRRGKMGNHGILLIFRAARERQLRMKRNMGKLAFKKNGKSMCLMIPAY